MRESTMHAQARDYEVTVRNDIVFAEHDGVKLIGDLYAPKGLDKAPVLVGVHGGGWQVGDRKFYRNWGNYLAKNGYAVFAIEYRLMKPGVKTWPGAVYDTKAAVQFVRAQAACARRRSRAHRPDRRQRGRASRRAGGARRRGAAVLVRIPRRPACGGVVQGEDDGRLLRRLRHGGAVGARSGHAAARQHRREAARRRADGEPQAVLRRLADELRHGRPQHDARFCCSTATRTTSSIRRRSRSASCCSSSRPASSRARSWCRAPGTSGLVDPVDEGFGAYAGPKVLRFLEGRAVVARPEQGLPISGVEC